MGRVPGGAGPASRCGWTRELVWLDQGAGVAGPAGWCMTSRGVTYEEAGDNVTAVTWTMAIVEGAGPMGSVGQVATAGCVAFEGQVGSRG
jgi:hypothetical protein